MYFPSNRYTAHVKQATDIALQVGRYTVLDGFCLICPNYVFSNFDFRQKSTWDSGERQLNTSVVKSPPFPIQIWISVHYEAGFVVILCICVYPKVLDNHVPKKEDSYENNKQSRPCHILDQLLLYHSPVGTMLEGFRVQSLIRYSSDVVLIVQRFQDRGNVFDC